jgi:hypothetical protein
MEVVINVCFGGFGLSILAEREYLKRKGKKAFFYKQTKYDFKDVESEYSRIDNDDEDSFLTYTFTKDHGKTFSKFPDGDKSGYFYDHDIARDDKDLIAVVKKLCEKASGQYAKLSIVEVPDGTKWEISEYDGNESVEEAHRSWR